jgi:hypothetical protein
MEQRFTIKVSPWWRPLLFLFGATPSRGWVKTGEHGIEARLGWYHLAIPWENVASAEPAKWPLYAGIGWRSDLRTTLGLIGSTAPVVRVRLCQPKRGRLLGLPLRYRDLYLSLDDPAGFRAAVESHRSDRGTALSTAPSTSRS